MAYGAWSYHQREQRRQAREVRAGAVAAHAGCSLGAPDDTLAVVITCDQQEHTLQWYRLLEHLVLRAACPARLSVFVGGTDAAGPALLQMARTAVARSGRPAVDMVVIPGASEEVLRKRLVRAKYTLCLRAPAVMAPHWDTTLIQSLRAAQGQGGATITSFGASAQADLPDFLWAAPSGRTLLGRSMTNPPHTALRQAHARTDGVPLVFFASREAAGPSHSPSAAVAFVPPRFRPSSLPAGAKPAGLGLHEEALRVIGMAGESPAEAHAKYGHAYDAELTKAFVAAQDRRSKAKRLPKKDSRTRRGRSDRPVSS
jgi:hypothetical protein